MTEKTRGNMPMLTLNLRFRKKLMANEEYLQYSLKTKRTSTDERINMYVHLEICVFLNSKENDISVADQIWLPNEKYSNDKVWNK